MEDAGCGSSAIGCSVAATFEVEIPGSSCAVG